MGKPKAPTAPDPAATVQAQAEANRVTTFSPFGDVLFGTVGEGGQFVPTQNGNQAAVQINPTDIQTDTFQTQQQAENLIAKQLAERVGNLPTGAVDLSGLNPLNTNFDQQGSELERATFDRAMGLLSPVFDQREKQMRSALSTRGLPVGSEAANEEISLFNQNRREAELAAALDAVGAGRQEQSRLFGLNQSARNQGLSEVSFQRNQPFNELAAALSGSQISPFQSAASPTQPIDVVGPQSLALQAQLANFNAQNQANSGLLGGLFSLGGSLLSTPAAGTAIFGSDRRLKDDIRRIGKLDNGIPIYTFRYKGRPEQHVGFMADEVEKVMPEAVSEIGGFKAVDYGRVVNA